MPEETMTAGELLAAYDACRTQHMETRIVRGEFDPKWGDNIARDRDGKPLTEDYPVHDAEVQHNGKWRKVLQVGTDLNDESRPVFLDIEGNGRQVLTMNDTVTVRGLSEPDAWAAPTR